MTKKTNSIVLFWFRRDLRLIDNKGLSQAIRHAKQNGHNFIPIFIFDPEILKKLELHDARVTFIWDALQVMQAKLFEHHLKMWIFLDDPLQVFQQIQNVFSIQSIFTNHDYEPYAIDRDARVNKWCEQNKIQFQTFKDQVIFEKNEVLTDQGKPYTVYTPYKKKWLQTFEATRLVTYDCQLKDLDSTIDLALGPLKLIHSMDDLHFVRSKIEIPPRSIPLSVLKTYASTRDFPALEDGTTRLGVHLRFGTVSPRQLCQVAVAQAEKSNRTMHTDIWLSELIWREFFMQILFHFPNSETKSFKPQYENIKWRKVESEIERWKNGETGYAIVDAGMRELISTGHMHNRVRMITASFLCKHLMHHWHVGERFFAKHLLDFDLSANVGNWQWAAGTGCDAAPYFRIFNPYTQAEKFDPKNEYIKKWVPEFLKESYKPMIDHAQARERCLNSYKAGLA